MIQAELVERCPDITILHHREETGVLWGTRGRWILRAQPGGGWKRIARFPAAFPRDLFGFSRPTSRALRADKANVFVNRQGGVLAIRASTVYRLEEGRLVPLFSIQGDSVLHGGICEDQTGWTYFGEYFMNPGRGEVRIWRVSPDLRSWEAAHTFRDMSIRHVHGVYRDPFDDQSLWVTTGDEDGECFFYCSNTRFESVERMGDGVQIWRAVRLFFTPAHICWLTDSQVEVNSACRMDRQTGELEVGEEMQAPCWYGAMTREGLYISFSTVEPGEAVRRATAGILVSRDAFHWQEVLHFKKDFWRPMKLFKYGVISCPSGWMSNEDFYISGEGLVGIDGGSARLSFTTGGNE